MAGILHSLVASPTPEPATVFNHDLFLIAVKPLCVLLALAGMRVRVGTPARDPNA
jgi:hypothetical protein